jgi:5-methyltetrahydrofolate--homocysteine methyltransferase
MCWKLVKIKNRRKQGRVLMKTYVKSASQEVTISRDYPFVVIGEKINPTGRKNLATALINGDFEYVKAIALRQVAAGADILDVNVGVPGVDEVDLLPKVAKLVSETVDVPLCLDSANRDALAAALAVLPGHPLVNSVNGEEASLEAILPVIKEFGAPVIGLVMDDDGIPNDADKRVAVAGKIIERAGKYGIPIEDIIIDPLVLTIGADNNAGAVTLETVRRVQDEFGVNINLGASNVSFGLPGRQTINQAFLALAIGAGATCAITDPIKLVSSIRAADLIVGRDNFAARYIDYWRKHKPEDV